MIEILLDLEQDTTILTCNKCALEMVEELRRKDCKFMQSLENIYNEIELSGIVEITKLKTVSGRDIFFVFGFEKEENLRDRVVLVDQCVNEMIALDCIPEESTCIIFCDFDDREIEEDVTPYSDSFMTHIESVFGEFLEEDDDELCDECLAVREIMEDESLVSVEDCIREAFRMGRTFALYDIQEIAENLI